MKNIEVGQALIARHESITSAESLTAGLFVSTLAEVPAFQRATRCIVTSLRCGRKDPVGRRAGQVD